MTPISDQGSLEQIYDQLLSVCFPTSELLPLATIADKVAGGVMEVIGHHDGKHWTAVSVGEFFLDEQICLLSWLAVDPRHRGGGLGSRILAQSSRRWRARSRFMLGEIEFPRGSSRPEYGDNELRARFYRSKGAVMIDIPYVQPALQPGEPEVPLLLIRLPLHHSWDATPLSTQLLVEFLDDYFRRPADDRLGRFIRSHITSGDAPTLPIPINANELASVTWLSQFEEHIRERTTF